MAKDPSCTECLNIQAAQVLADLLPTPKDSFHDKTLSDLATVCPKDHAQKADTSYDQTLFLPFLIFQS